MPEKKEPGQITYYASHPAGTWAVLGPEEKAYYERVEAAVLAAHKPERAAGVWLNLVANEVQSATFLVLSQIATVSHIQGHWEVEAFTPNGDSTWMITEAFAHRIVAALGGEWPGEAPYA